MPTKINFKCSTNHGLQLLLATLLSILLVACSTGGQEHNYPRPEILLQVPPYRTGFNQCGISAVGSVLDYYSQKDRGPDLDTRPFNLIKHMHSVDTVKMVKVIRESGLSCRFGVYDLEALVDDLAHQKPVLVFVPSSEDPIDRWATRQIQYHCWVLRGLSQDRMYLYYNDPGKGPLIIAVDDFERKWQQSDYLAIRFND